MNPLYYTGQGVARSQTSLPVNRKSDYLKPEGYVADPGLVHAANVALILGQPLLLTGEPGTGKTQLAYSVAWELALGEPLKFETKSTSVSRDLFYIYDALGRFQAAQSGLQDQSVVRYIKYNALGLAILRTNEEQSIRHYVSPDFQHGTRTRSVVLIDEIDKAPRDFPNDLLNELEHMYFRIPELGDVKVEADAALHPILIITSNSEKDLPDAFLRRCVYYNVPFPGRERMAEIVSSRLGVFTGGTSDFLSDALDVFYMLRQAGIGLRKKPATAELLGWLIGLRSLDSNSSNPLADRPELAIRTLSTLIKTAEDQERATEALQQWMNRKHL